MSNRVIFIGAVETDADLFAAKALTDIPGLDLFATNDRNWHCAKPKTRRP